MIKGNAVTIASATSMIKKKGAEPINTSPRLFPEIALRMKTFTPTGGVSKPISVSNTKTTPNQITSYPSILIIGSMAGSVISIADRPSMKQPKNI